MKKILGFMVLMVLLSNVVFADGFTIQGQFGLGGGATKIDDIDISSLFPGVDEVAIHFGVKAGYGPFGKIPLYVVLNLSGIGYRLYDSYNYLQFNSYMVGPGVLFYPHPIVQLGLSMGPSWISNKNDLGIVFFGNDGPGFAIDISAVLDIGYFWRSTIAKNFGLLVGFDYFSATNTLENSGVKEVSNAFTFTTALSYRHPPRSLFGK
ncbi:hypothetical protein AGMMS50293_10580 [Spirochaetia bacterium]|nr:hypothetical protein AGMMS50293_10580 [Spirochaetia bacterium]